jgi:ABC-2 type transport system ATP-binding protein
MIEVSDLSKSYGPVQALNRVSFEVAEGEILGFLGPNGAGKSTTMRILTGFLPGDSGRVRVAGHDVRTESMAVRQETGYLPEGVPLYPEMRVREYLRFRARLKGVPFRRRRALVDEALSQAGVGDLHRRVIGTLSRGYRQRVGLASALLARPRVLILDEPTVGLDPAQVRQFRSLLREVGADRTVILSTHILSEVELVCSSVAVIERGRIVAHGTAADLRRTAGESQRVVFEVNAPAAEVRRALAEHLGVERVEEEEVRWDGRGDGRGEAAYGYHRYRVDVLERHDLREKICDLVQERRWKLRELTREELPLEDIFVNLVKKFRGGGAPDRHPGGGDPRA